MELRNYINGVWKSSTSVEQIGVIDPATEDRIAVLPAGSAEDVDEAVAAARHAQPAWADLSSDERVALLLQCADAFATHRDELVELERQDMGKPADVGGLFTAGAISSFEGDVREALNYSFSTVITQNESGRALVVRYPVGVAALLTPWNFTAAVILGAVGSILGAGNTVVVKPSEKSPLSAVRLFELFAALPPGVVNLVLGDGRAGRPLASHPGVDLVHFTGSVRTGRSVGAAAGGNLNRAVLELGGKDPVVIDADVDVAQVARDVAFGAFANSGQLCTSIERIYVHRAIADRFIESLVDEARRLAEGDGVIARLGPLVDSRQRDLVHRHVLDATDRGATVERGGCVPRGRGFFYPPTVITGVNETMVIMNEETFGPLAPVQVVDSFNEGLERAAQTDFGLAATVYTSNEAHALAAHRLPAGLVWINKWHGGVPGQIYEPAKESGVGATGGRAAYDAATRPTAVYEAWGGTQP
jgi:acyl-CoA reductase-like NAD-dependent aldehyde dehydrogenase